MGTRTTADASLLDDVRDAVDARLQAAVGAGHLSLDEYERRLGTLLSDQSTGPTVSLQGAGLADVLVKSQSEMESGKDLDIIVHHR